MSTPQHKFLVAPLPFGLDKMEWWGYITVKKNFEDMYNRLDRVPACDRRTDLLPRHSK